MKNCLYHFILLTIIPFVHTIDGVIPRVEGPCVAYGSIRMQTLAIEQNWIPGVWANDQFNESILQAKLGYRYMNPDLCTMMISNADVFFKENPGLWFIKPNTDTKQFAGTTMESNDFWTWYNNMKSIGYLDEENFEVVVSSPKNSYQEWRVAIVDGKAIDCSAYLSNRRSKQFQDLSVDVMQFAEECAAIHSPTPVFMCDVSLGDDGYKCIEYNAFNSAAWYMMNCENLISTINTYVGD